ncbi:MAG: [protein-PII] uridylyltransferase [Thiobacillus sp.]|uniref:[protein-PII] uridylyltransferase n=1 Tax=unclassified Thiobacillus TaxID=2646513 RepID=UPI00095FA7F5|nr:MULTISPECIES: [protein-PII] uridylyltransferase [unclassified Thiobacillus]MBN8771093.1 [protein-PII] uridylyltransferase [Thiobacillus sp.]MBN8780249.1 [protein-PII] uridylyltransferase [Thiobacillus sp.]OJY55711.1 MAG: [protein-PII] uridylyltransferase [Thiobacillus sp. 0-1251]
MSKPPFADLRERLKSGRSDLAAAFLRKSTTHYLSRHAALVDSVLIELSARLALPPTFCLAAVGGYGRGELFPGSDVDVLMVLPHDPTPDQQATLENWVQACWDVGLEIGHSVRTVDACLAEAADITVETNLLEARFIYGAASLFDEFGRCFQARFDAQHFFDGKLAEQQARHARFDDSAYKLEPNLKDSPGGLRDLHTIHWLAQACGIQGSWSGIARAGLLTSAEARRIAREEYSLAALRIHLHLLSGRREDRLAFDYQTELAARLGLAATTHKRAGERLMQGYYRAAKLIQRVNDILIQSLRVRLFPVTAPPEPIDADFQLRANLLEARAADLFERKPDALLRAFIVYAQHPTLAGFEPATLRALWRGSTRIDAAFRADPLHRTLFMTLLRQPVGITRALRAMHRYGLLGRYIPAFGRVVGQMQHDLFHVYTVDEHILTVLRNVRRFTVADLAHEFPLASRLIAAFDKPELLYLAALFHDIAKGRGGDHSELGAVDARRFCRQHQLDKADSELVAWLVDMHLVMSRTSQKEDISDPAVIAAFAVRVGDTRRLAALYLLTVADIRGTSPKVWNAWKGKLLEDLYHATHARLAGSDAAVADIAARQNEARVNLALYGLPASAADALWKHLDERYFVRFDARDMAWQARMLWRRTDSADAVVRARLSPAGEGIQVLVYTPDRADIFARICGFFARIQYTILEAKIHTTRNGYALDSFQVMDLANRGIHYRDFLNFVEYELARDLDPTRPMQPVPRGRLSRHQRHHPYPTTVRLEADAQGNGHMLSITCADRGGLLFAVAEVLMRHDVNVYAAKIDTLGERVEDTFLIRGAALQTPAGREALETETIEALK